LRVVIADRHPTAAFALQIRLEKWGVDAVVAQGSDTVPDRPFDLALVDENLPDLEATLAKVRKCCEPDRIVRMVEMGRFPTGPHLLKPVGASQLRSLLHALAVRGTRAHEPEPETRPERPLEILVAEDNRINQVLIEKILERLGHRVTLAGDGQAAIDAFTRGRFDLVLMDVQMPDLDGIEATRLIRRCEADREIRTPVIALTAHAIDDHRQVCLAAGMDDFLTKPIDVAMLDAKLRAWTGEAVHAC
jgi:CheY-like chemotaxis protein